MAHYIILFQWTDLGIRNVKNSPKRIEAARKEAETLINKGYKFIGVLPNGKVIVQR